MTVPSASFRQTKECAHRCLLNRPRQSKKLKPIPPPCIHPGPCRQELRGQLDREKAEFQEIAVQQHLVLEQHEANEAQLEGQLAAARQELEQVSVQLVVSLAHMVVGTKSQVQLVGPLAAVRQELK